jgi:antitoxin VapB
MALNIKNRKVEHLIEEIIAITGETKTEAILNALREKKQRLIFRINPVGRRKRKLTFLQSELWPEIPETELGQERIKSDIEEVLGYGREGV